MERTPIEGAMEGGGRGDLTPDAIGDGTLKRAMEFTMSSGVSAIHAPIVAVAVLWRNHAKPTRKTDDPAAAVIGELSKGALRD